MENIPQIKRDEQYPLLKVDGGGGDAIKHTRSPTVVSSRWNVVCIPKKSWFDRWPEFISVCWMTLILMAISFLVFYALGMSAYRRQHFVIMRCNDSKPATNVYYHHIVPRGSNVPIKLVTDYISYMATRYPSLHFHIYFLKENSWLTQFEDSKHSKLFKGLVPQLSRTFNLNMDQSYKQDIWDFQRKHENVNISVINLIKYVAMTPLKYRWRSVSPAYLPFYLRAYEIWKNGGIAFDLMAFNDKFNITKRIDHRIEAILNQYVEGIEPDKYQKILESLDEEEENHMFSQLFNYFNNLFSQVFFKKDLSTDFINLNDKPVIRTHRTKRETTNDKIRINISPQNQTNINTSSTMLVDTTKAINKTKDMNINETKALKDTNFTKSKTEYLLKHHINQTTTPQYKESEIWPEFLVLYEFSGLVDNNEPYHDLSKFIFKSKDTRNINKADTILSNHKKNTLNYLTISHEGNFIAASAPYHPFLLKISNPNLIRLNPIFAIKDAIWRQCSGLLMTEFYCNSIHLFTL